MSYSIKLREEELKNKVAHDYFIEYDNTRIIGNILHINFNYGRNIFISLG